MTAVAINTAATQDRNHCKSNGGNSSSSSSKSVDVMKTTISSIQKGTLEDIEKKYKILDTIGQGTFGLVKRCQRRIDDKAQIEEEENKKADSDSDNNETKDKLYAVKIIRKDKVPDLKLLQTEVELLQTVDHPHIIRLYEAMEDQKHFYLITELCTGGELYDRVVQKSLEDGPTCFSEYDAARILRNILDAIQYCHDQGIAHRDLKVENFLLLSPHDDSPVKIIDFGLSRFTSAADGHMMMSRVGTVYYVAPEVVLAKSYTTKCDIWSIGVIAYVLLCGYPPFMADNEAKTLQLVTNPDTQVEFPSPSWDRISIDAKQFVLRLLDRDVDRRPTAKEALQDKWLNNRKVQPPGLAKMASFRSSERSESEHTSSGTHTDQNKNSTNSSRGINNFNSTAGPAIQMKTSRRERFSSFLQRIRHRKRGGGRGRGRGNKQSHHSILTTPTN